MPERGLRVGTGLLGILLIAVNLRVGFVTVGPLLEGISDELGLSAGQAGLLAGLPLLAFALLSPIAPVLARVAGLDRASWLSVLLLAVGIVLRSVELPGMIWAGTILLGAGIAFLNVLVPSIVKRQFPGRVGQVTGFYTSAQGAVAALGAAIVVPVAQVTPSGWRLALGMWVGLALLALAVLGPWLLRSEPKAAVSDSAAPALRSPWTSLLGWQVTLFMGFQSITYYVIIAWLPTIERSHGVSEADAGFHMALFFLVGVCASLGTGAAMSRLADQRAVGLAASLLALASYLGLMLAPGLMLLWVITAAIACGALIVVALSLFSLRTTNHAQAAGLSGMAQSVGYAIAGAGPLAFGLLYEATGAFELPLLLTACCMAVLCVLAVLVGRPRTIG
ncbi:MFS transporter [Arthrobacter oryzae]|uniref:MFS transporter n=2 Tax=Arthrobacter oryzae TaxID=409290 RepID=A0A3N0C5N6_9MICC|nr:MFS transporter [Arthrobacter oryzae]